MPCCATPSSCSRASRFFFQAEDGIRDVAVTGVQTCALPICRSLQNDLNGARLRRLTQHGPVRLETLRTQRELEAVIGEIAAQCDLHQAARTGRSEERRVGKEGRSRWWACP